MIHFPSWRQSFKTVTQVVNSDNTLNTKMVTRRTLHRAPAPPGTSENPIHPRHPAQRDFLPSPAFGQRTAIAFERRERTRSQPQAAGAGGLPSPDGRSSPPPPHTSPPRRRGRSSLPPSLPAPLKAAQRPPPARGKAAPSPRAGTGGAPQPRCAPSGPGLTSSASSRTAAVGRRDMAAFSSAPLPAVGGTSSGRSRGEMAAARRGAQK